MLISGPWTALAEKAARKEHWCAPVLWRSEFRNVLAWYLRRNALTLDDAHRQMAAAERLLWNREFTVRSAAVLDCIHRSNRSACDCEFVALAMELGIPLVTTDDPVIHDFPDTAIHLREFVKG